MSYQFKYMPKLILGGSFEQFGDEPLITIVDDPDALKKAASSRVVAEWGEIVPKKNASLIHLIALGAHEFTGCFFQGTMVQTISGMKPIENIRTGDLVLTHNNRFRPVTALFEGPYDGERTSIKISGVPEKEVSTGNHPFWIVRAENFTTHHRCPCHFLKKGKTKDEVVSEAVQKAEFVSARDVRVGDFMIIPVKPAFDGEVEQFSMEQARMFGYYLGDGCIARETRKDRSAYGLPDETVFTLSEAKRAVVDDIKQIVKNWFDRDINENESLTSEEGIRLSVSDKDNAQRMSSLMGHLARTKFLSPVLFQQSKEWTLQFLASYFDCDGCVSTDCKNSKDENTIKASTASLNLALDLQRLLASVGVPSSFSKGHNLVKNGCFGKEDGIIYGVSIGGSSSLPIISLCRRLRIINPSDKRIQAHHHTNGEYILAPVTSVSTDLVEGEVKFNLEVEEDNTYVTSVIGHNSNRNGDSFKAEFLKRAHPTFKKHGALYRDHKSKDYEKREGNVEKTAFNDEMGRVELLVSADHDKCSDWLDDIDRGKRVDFSMGFDCFDGSVLVKTDTGDKRIDQILVGDQVLTHKGSFMPVTAVLPSNRGNRRLLKIKMQTRGEPLLVTEDHKILVVRRNMVRKPVRDRWPDFMDRMIPEWVDAGSIAKGDYMLRPVIQASGETEIDSGVAYLLGQYLGDGTVSEFTDNSVAITTNVSDAHLLKRMVDICLRLGWDFSVDYLNYDRELCRKKQATSLRIREPEFALMCKRYCGRYKDKYVRQEVWEWSLESMMFFLGGYVDADGSYDPESNVIRTSSVLDKLNETVQQMFFTAGIVATTWKDWFGLREGGPSFGNTTEYSNVLFVNKSDAWKLHGYSMKVEPGESVRAQENIFFDHAGTTYLACPVSDTSEAEAQPEIVYCLTVEEDHSFVAEGAVVHNCEYDECSICHHKAATRKEYCDHVKKGAKEPYGMGKILPDGRKCYVDNPKGVFNDISKVGTGADMIAQHLRKVAGLEDEMVGGAELMEMLFPEVPLEKFAVKMAIANKMSAMEKILPVVGIKYEKKRVRMKDKTARILRGMPADVMFGELSKLGCLLPLRDFFHLVMGDRIGEIEEHVDAAEKVAHLAMTHAVSSSETLDEVCRNKSFECKQGALFYSPLTCEDRDNLFFEFGMDMDLAEERLVKEAIHGERAIEPTSLEEASPVARRLLSEYASYKLAAIEAGLIDFNNEDSVRLAAMIH